MKLILRILLLFPICVYAQNYDALYPNKQSWFTDNANRIFPLVIDSV
jgi:hypothetical protein